MPQSIVALLTDFGHRDGYTGVMKGVILSLYRDALLVDIAHDIPPQDVWHASWVLDHAFDYFPARTVFVCVVDPHVGDPDQQKLAIFFEAQKKALVLPDNGLATRILDRYPDAQCWVVTNPQFYLNEQEPSRTFQGRDVYAPVGAHLAKALEQGGHHSVLAFLGPTVPLNDLKRLTVIPPQQPQPGVFQGQVDVVDTYGNLITNIPSLWVTEPGGYYELVVDEHTYRTQHVSHYGELLPVSQWDVPVVMVDGSHGMVEISCPNASARDTLNITPGTSVTLRAT